MQTNPCGGIFIYNQRHQEPRSFYQRQVPVKDHTGETLGKYYKILEKVGEGGLAVTYRAWHNALERPVIIKFIDVTAIADDAIERLVPELKRIAMLRHPNITQLFDYGWEQDEFHLVLEDATKYKTLASRLGHPIPWQEATRILLTVMSALHYARQRDVIHAPLTPSDVVLYETGEPIVLNFEQRSISILYASALRAEEINGSVAYMAPEVLKGEPANAQSDIFSLGVILYEMVTGRKPYSADTDMSYALSQIYEPVPPLSQFVKELPPALEQVILKALTKNPADRYQDLQEFEVALLRVSNWTDDSSIQKETSPITSQKPIDVRPKPDQEVGKTSPSGWYPAPPKESFLRRVLGHVFGRSEAEAEPLPSKPTSSPPTAKPPTSMSAPPKPADEVAFTAFHPKEGQADAWQSLLVYAHVTSAAKAVRNDAQKYKDEIQPIKETTSKTSARIARGTELSIIPSCTGVTFNPAQVTFRWAEEFHRASFRFKAEPSLAGDAVSGQISIHAGPLLISTIKFAMLFNDKTNSPSLGEQVEQATMYSSNRIFISYSHNDTELALLFRNVLEAVGYDVLIDIDDLRAGQVWNAELMNMIERADIFQLFWSSNSSQSEYCRREWQHALQQEKPDGYIRPIYWRKPLPTPPEELSKFHFDFVELQLPASDAGK